jgi:DNA modification methylase
LSNKKAKAKVKREDISAPIEMKVRCAHTEMVDIDTLVPNPLNPNEHPEEQIRLLAKILAYQGWRSPIVVSNRSGFMTKGHGRLLAAKYNGWSRVPVDRQDYESEADEYADMVADNKVAEMAATNMKRVNEDASKLPDNFDLELLGIPDFEIVPTEVLDPQCDPDDMPEKVPPRAKPGDIYKLGRHRVMCGDSTMIDHILKLLDGTQIDLVLTDPPYNVAVNDESEASLKARNRRKDGLKIANDKMSEEEFREFLLTVFTNYFTVMKDGASIYVFYADSMTIPFMTTFMEAGFHFAQNCIWAKQQFVMTRKDYHYKHEPVMYGWKKGEAHTWEADRKQSSIWEFDRPFRNELHPTMKPIDLMEYPLLNSSREGAAILDLFGGSGSTLIAAEKNNRKCFIMELDPHYTDVIVARWEKYTGNKAELVSGKEEVEA